MVNIKIQENIKNKKCFWCGKDWKFQSWQFYNLSSKNKNKHEYCLFCSDKCFGKAKGTKIKRPIVKMFDLFSYPSGFIRGRFHNHTKGNNCFGEYRGR